MKIVNIVNSFIGRKGNIGFRTAYVLDELNKEKIENFSYSRGIEKGYEKNNKNMGIFGNIPRILNAIRIYINLHYNHRKHDIWLFEKFLNLTFQDINDSKKVVHFWEYSPKTIKILQSKGFCVILDVPIAPSSTAKDLMKKYKDTIILHPHEYNSKLEIKSYQLADYIIAPSSFVKNEILKLGINFDKIFIVPFGADINYNYEKDFIKDFKKGIDFCFAGTINKRKGLEFLLEAWNDKAFENDRLHLCGRLFPEIETILKKYNFKNIILPGFINTKEYFKKCDVYVFPSLLEGSSKSIYEAMNMNLPCIVTPNSGSIIENGFDGFIIDVASVEDLKDKMLKFKEDNQLISIMGKNAKNKVQNYSWDRYAKNVINIYKKVSL